ncbi:MAG: penicillin-binding protein activator LpoB [Cellvibrionales bacterium]|jgi:uncharacterized protein (TIGR02722 family)|nr:penicillin-binding protein activator LpoB [Cellvibrionales bacterium]
MRLFTKAVTVAFTLTLLGGCASGGSKVGYVDATSVETVDESFGSSDLQQIAGKMVQDMLIFPPVVQATSGRRPVLYIDRIENKTTEHVDTESITDTIQSKMINSGKFRFVDMGRLNEISQQMAYQRKSGMVDQSTAVATGRGLGAEYALYGNLSSIVKRNGGTKSVYYKFTLKLQHIETQSIEWVGEKEIRKEANRSLFGS